MSRKNHAMRGAVPVLTLACCGALLLAGCGGSAASIAASTPAGGAAGASAVASVPAAASAQAAAPGDDGACAATEQVYASFLAGTLPQSSDGGTKWDDLAYALGNAAGGESSSMSDLDLAIDTVGSDATSISDANSEDGAGAQNYQQFDKDLQLVGKDCGTTFKPLPKYVESEAWAE
jgi:hypothetical protein